MLSIPVVGIVFGYLFQQNGLVNSALETVGLGALAQDWLGSSTWALPTIMAVVIWKELGFGVIVFLARLISVPEEHLRSGADRRRGLVAPPPTRHGAAARAGDRVLRDRRD